MAIKFGMTVLEIIGQLTRGFIKAMGRKPDGLEKLKIQQEAVQRFKDMNKVVDMGGRPIDTSKGIMGGTQVGQRGMFDNIFARMQSQMGKNVKEVKTKNRPDVYDLDDYDTTNMSDIKKEIIRTETKLGNLNPESKGFRKAAKELADKIVALKNKLRDDKAMGGRIGLKEGKGIMQMASVDDPFYRDSESDRDDFSFRMFNKPYKELNEEELEEFREEMMRLMNKFSAREKEDVKMASMDDDYEAEFMKLVGEFMERGFNQQEAIDAARDELERLRDKFVSAPDPMADRNDMMENLSRRYYNKPLKDLTEDEIIELEEAFDELTTKKDRGAPSITLADGGRAAFKDGTGMFEKLFFNKERPILSGLNTGALFDLVVAAKDAAGPLIGLAEGGRIGYKDGPKDPRRRTFMKAAAGLASLLPFGAAKIVGKAAPVVAKAAEITGPALAKIVETVMSLGKLVSVKGRRVKEMVTKKKHEGVEVTEDIQDGSYVIKKGDKEIYYKPGRQDETGGFDDDIIEVIEKRIEKAGGGGIGYMLGE